MTTKQVLLEYLTGGHRIVIGTPEQVADDLIDWVDTDACDGFNFNIDRYKDGLEHLVDWLVPELQARGRFRTEYESHHVPREPRHRRRRSVTRRELAVSPVSERLGFADLVDRLAAEAPRRDTERLLFTDLRPELRARKIGAVRLPRADGNGYR